MAEIMFCGMGNYIYINCYNLPHDITCNLTEYLNSPLEIVILKRIIIIR